jgi:hypothetical protein
MRCLFWQLPHENDVVPGETRFLAPQRLHAIIWTLVEPPVCSDRAFSAIRVSVRVMSLSMDGRDFSTSLALA